MNKKIKQSRKGLPSKSMGPTVRQVIPTAIENIDPFVFLDHFGPFEKKPNGQGVPPHPHAGIATITYLFSGSNRHQDSYGHDAVVQTGDIAWMQAGKGIVHAEGMNENRTESEIVNGLQFWISLPAKDKFTEPAFYHHSSAELPIVKIDNASIKILCGELLGQSSPIKSLSPAYIYEIKVPANEHFHIPINTGDTAGLYIIDGDLEIDNQTIKPEFMTSFDEMGDTIEIKSVEQSHFMLFGGTPLKEPIVGYASYVMNSEEQIRQVMQDYQLGKMGTVNV